MGCGSSKEAEKEEKKTSPPPAPPVAPPPVVSTPAAPAAEPPKAAEEIKPAETTVAASDVKVEVAAEEPKKVEAAPAAPVEVKVPEVPGELPADLRIVFVLGGPGSGKGTQCERIVKKYGYAHLSAGDLLRDEVQSGSEAGQLCDKIMKEGGLVPMHVTITLLRNAMVRKGGSKFLIDGFPRALDQAAAFEAGVRECTSVIFFDCPEETMESRLLHRGKTSGRADDNAATIKKRFKTFVEQSLPVITHFEALSKVHKISSIPGPDEVFEAVSKAMDSIEGVESKDKATKDAVPAVVVEEAKAAAPAPEPTPAVVVAQPVPAAVEEKAAPPPAEEPKKEESKKVEAAPAAPVEVKVPEVPGELPADLRIVFVLGGPGSGKGTQCERIKRKYGYAHLSAGDLLRDEVQSGSEAGQLCDKIMKEGGLVPMHVTITLLRNAMVRKGGSKFLIDGFPRALDQAAAFEAGVRECTSVIFFDCPEETMESRLLHRGKTSGRADDNAATIKKRFKTFVDQSLPVITHFEALSKVHKISSIPGPDEVFEAVSEAMDSIEGVEGKGDGKRHHKKKGGKKGESEEPVAPEEAKPAAAVAAPEPAPAAEEAQPAPEPAPAAEEAKPAEEPTPAAPAPEAPAEPAQSAVEAAPAVVEATPAAPVGEAAPAPAEPAPAAEEPAPAAPEPTPAAEEAQPAPEAPTLEAHSLGDLPSPLPPTPLPVPSGAAGEGAGETAKALAFPSP